MDALKYLTDCGLVGPWLDGRVRLVDVAKVLELLLARGVLATRDLLDLGRRGESAWGIDYNLSDCAWRLLKGRGIVRYDPQAQGWRLTAAAGAALRGGDGA